MRVLVLAGLVMLSGCGGGGTTGTNYSDPPPMAEIVATPSPKPSPSEEAAPANVAVDDAAASNADEAVSENAL